MDSQYLFSKYAPSLRKHDYGPNVKLLNDPYLLSLAAKLSAASTVQPMLNELLRESYGYMLGQVLNAELPLKAASLKTRMYQETKRAVFEAKIFDPNTKFAVTNLMRAGIVPSFAIYDRLCGLFKPQGIRVDNIFISRVTNKNGMVTGANISGAKIGDDLDDMYILIPDPMGATGSSIIKVLNFYKMIKGRPKKIIIMGLIITPEYLKNVRRHFPDVMIYSVRLDRAMSDPEILRDIPGKNWNMEKGINKKGYIVPGLGGLGELINNTTF